MTNLDELLPQNWKSVIAESENLEKETDSVANIERGHMVAYLAKTN